MKTAWLLRLTMSLVMVVGWTAMPGCGSGYALKGRVIRGNSPGIEVVHEMDLRFREPAGGGPVAPDGKTGIMPAGAGVGQAEVSLYRDPSTLNRHLAARDRTNGEGDFTLHIKDFGA